MNHYGLALQWAFREAYHRDVANSAIHITQPQWRPLTALLARALNEWWQDPANAEEAQWLAQEIRDKVVIVTDQTVDPV